MKVSIKNQNDKHFRMEGVDSIPGEQWHACLVKFAPSETRRIPTNVKCLTSSKAHTYRENCSHREV
jgi:hypothetical protein